MVKGDNNNLLPNSLLSSFPCLLCTLHFSQRETVCCIEMRLKLDGMFRVQDVSQ